MKTPRSNIEPKAKGDIVLLDRSILENGVQIVFQVQQYPIKAHIATQSIDQVTGVVIPFEFVLDILPVPVVLQFLTGPQIKAGIAPKTQAELVPDGISEALLTFPVFRWADFKMDGDHKVVHPKLGLVQVIPKFLQHGLSSILHKDPVPLGFESVELKGEAVVHPEPVRMLEDPGPPLPPQFKEAAPPNSIGAVLQGTAFHQGVVQPYGKDRVRIGAPVVSFVLPMLSGIDAEGALPVDKDSKFPLLRLRVPFFREGQDLPAVALQEGNLMFHYGQSALYVQGPYFGGLLLKL